MPKTLLPDRALVRASGPDAESLLQNVITTDLTSLEPGEARPGALLTPQGKILFDFLVSRAQGEGLNLECRGDVAADLLKRLTLYRLRAKVELSLADQSLVTVSWDDESAASDGDSSVLDRRFPDGSKVLRRYGETGEAENGAEAWHRLRIAHGVAESGADYALGEAFPHDVLYDQNGGVGLRKGCFVGQEVVSRMHHRGTARRRLVIVRGESPLPASGAELRAEGRSLGSLGTVSGADGLAIVRIDRAAEAKEAGTPILAGDVAVTLTVPAYARFSLDPEGKAETT